MGLGTGVAVLNSQVVPITQVALKTAFTVLWFGFHNETRPTIVSCCRMLGGYALRSNILPLNFTSHVSCTYGIYFWVVWNKIWWRRIHNKVWCPWSSALLSPHTLFCPCKEVNILRQRHCWRPPLKSIWRPPDNFKLRKTYICVIYISQYVPYMCIQLLALLCATVQQSYCRHSGVRRIFRFH